MATLRHHWRFNGNLADSVGDAHFVNESDPTVPTEYIENKDGVTARALLNDTGVVAHWTEPQAGFDGKYCISAWIQRPLTTMSGDHYIFAFGNRNGGIAYSSAGLVFSTHASAYIYRIPFNATTGIGDWTHIVMLIDRGEGTLRVYMDGFYKGGFTDNSYTKTATGTGNYCLNGIYTTSASNIGNRVNVDEIIVFDGWLTGDLTTHIIDNRADGEILELYQRGTSSSAPFELEEATVRHHWKFDGNLNDSVGNAHFTGCSNLNYKVKYTINKERQEGKALNNYPMWRKAYSSNVVDGFSGKCAMSAWVQRSSSSSSSSGYSYGVVCLFNLFGIGVEPTKVTFIQGSYSGGYRTVSIPSTIDYGDWFHVLLQIDRTTGGLKGYINGVLVVKYSTTAYTGPLPASSFFLNYNSLSPNQNYVNASNSDEIKVYDGWLTDGDIEVGQQAKGEVLELYFEGVNNIKRPTITQISNITHEGADVSWT